MNVILPRGLRTYSCRRRAKGLGRGRREIDAECDVAGQRAAAGQARACGDGARVGDITREDDRHLGHAVDAALGVDVELRNAGRGAVGAGDDARGVELRVADAAVGDGDHAVLGQVAAARQARARGDDAAGGHGAHGRNVAELHLVGDAAVDVGHVARGIHAQILRELRDPRRD